MYPWNEALTTWSDNTHLHIDALGLVTLLGAEDIDTSVGRLVPSLYFDTLPLLGAFVIAGNRFAEKQPGYALYNISAGIMTTELAAWFSRWLKAQELHQVRSIVSWSDTEPVAQSSRFWVGFVLIGLPLNGMLVALTVLTDDWWGFANAISMILSVLVRFVLIAQNRAGIDVHIAEAKKGADRYMANQYAKDMTRYEEKLKAYEDAISNPYVGVSPRKKPVPPRSHYQSAKAIVIRDDSKVVTLVAPEYLMRVFAVNPQIPHPVLYTVFIWIGWFSFAVHIISIGMSSLPTQIYTVLLLGIATILNVSKVGCDDSVLWRKLKSWGRLKGHGPEAIHVSSTLQASFSEYDEEYCFWEMDGSAETWRGAAPGGGGDDGGWWPLGGKGWGRRDVEGQAKKPLRLPERRQDLFAWLDLEEEEEETMKAWNLLPRTEQWWDVYHTKKTEQRARVRARANRRAGTTTTKA